MLLKEINKNYHFQKQKLKQWLINEQIIPQDYQEDIYLLDIDPHIIDETAIKHTVVRKKYQTQEDYEAPYMIPMTFNILPLHHFVIIDTETTGLSSYDEVIELSIIDELGNELYHSLFKPHKKMGKEAIQITGLSPRLLKDQPLFKEEWPRIHEILLGKTIIGHNIEYDERLITSTCLRYDIPLGEVKALFVNKVDSMKLIERYINASDYKLATLAKMFGIEDTQKHRATYDCLMTLQVLRKVESYLINHGYPYERRIDMNMEKAIYYAYKSNKSIEDLSIFFGLSCQDIVDILLKYDDIIFHDQEKSQKVLMIYDTLKDKDEIYEKASEYAHDYEIKLILKKK